MGKKFKYKLNEGPELNSWQIKRIEGFERIEDLLGQLAPLLKSAKEETIKYYKENPNSLNVLYSTDITCDYILDLIKLFKQ